VFDVILGIRRNANVFPFTVRIEGCPHNGVKAVDFRRFVGLPDGATYEITLEGIIFKDEEFVRESGLANDDADLNMEYYRQKETRLNGCCEIVVAGGYSFANKNIEVEPAAIASYLEKPCPETAKLVIKSIMGYQERTRLVAEENLRKHNAEREAKQKEIAFARELLRDEIASKDMEIASLKQQLMELGE
jgi:hypothetical protein